MNPKVIQCIKGSNDFQVLLHHLNITRDNFESSFEEASKKSGLELHYSFTNLTSLFESSTLNDTEKNEKIAQ